MLWTSCSLPCPSEGRKSLLEEVWVPVRYEVRAAYVCAIELFFGHFEQYIYLGGPPSTSYHRVLYKISNDTDLSGQLLRSSPKTRIA